jgi:hypothetical protein
MPATAILEHPTELTADQLTARTLERRAIEAVIWGMPAVNYDLMYQAMAANKGAFNQIAYWSRLPDWKIQTLTPNPDAIYLTPFINTKDVGRWCSRFHPPMRVRSPAPSWMSGKCALEDVGPAGVDKGQGGKYLILPPGYKDTVPAGYIPMPSDTYEGYACCAPSEERQRGRRCQGGRLRQADQALSALSSGHTAGDDLRRRVGRRVRQHHHLRPAVLRVAQPHRAGGTVAGTGQGDDRSAQVDRHREGANRSIPTRDAGHPRTTRPAKRTPGSWLDTRRRCRPTTKADTGRGRDRASCSRAGDVFREARRLPVDVRGVTFSYAYFTPKHVGAGSSYLLTIADKDGRLLDGGTTYRLTVPANAPVRQYWSATVYDRATHAPIRNARWPSRSSQTPGLQKNADGSVDIYFGPRAPAGKESNWVPTSTDGGFEVLFRFYGPEKPLFEKTWRLPDIEKETRQS